MFENKTELISYEYTCGGGKAGGYKSISIVKNGEKALVKISNKDFHYEDMQISEYLVPVSVLTQIKEVINKNKMYGYNHLKKSKTIIRDADTSSYYFLFENNKSIRFSDSNIIPQNGMDGIAEINKIISEELNRAESSEHVQIEE